jgi:predicted flap endonuclease-1-like 5' DNA nuclease
LVQMIEANWLIFIAALLIGIVVAYWVFVRATKPAQRDRRPDVLDEGAAPARRNQSLIDAPPAAHIDPPPVAGTMAGIGESTTASVQEEVDAAAAAAAEKKKAEQPAAVPQPEPAPEPKPASAPASGEADDLRKIKGLGPKMLALLHSLGVTRYEQIASWTDADLDELDTRLGSFAGRPRRDNWVEQARLLASGDTGAYEAKFGKL